MSDLLSRLRKFSVLVYKRGFGLHSCSFCVIPASYSWSQSLFFVTVQMRSRRRIFVALWLQPCLLLSFLYRTFIYDIHFLKLSAHVFIMLTLNLFLSFLILHSTILTVLLLYILFIFKDLLFIPKWSVILDLLFYGWTPNCSPTHHMRLQMLFLWGWLLFFGSNSWFFM